MERRYHLTEKENAEAVRGFLSKNGQAWLPLVEPIEQAEVALDGPVATVNHKRIDRG